jgi:hypothetical protein
VNFKSDIVGVVVHIPPDGFWPANHSLVSAFPPSGGIFTSALHLHLCIQTVSNFEIAHCPSFSVLGRAAFGPNAGRRSVRLGDQIDPESIEALGSLRVRHRIRFQFACEHRGSRRRPSAAGTLRSLLRPAAGSRGASRSARRWALGLSFQASFLRRCHTCGSRTAGDARKTSGIGAGSQGASGEILRRARTRRKLETRVRQTLRITPATAKTKRPHYQAVRILACPRLFCL